MPKVLVTYATKYGATREIAERISTVLTESGATTDVLPVDSVSGIEGYDAVVLGSAVYAGQWRKEAVAFLENNEAALTTRPVWIFSTGPTGTGDPVETMKGWRFPEAQQPIADRIKPKDMVLFHGMIDMNQLNFAEKLIIKGMRVQTGDYRDWDMITNWAKAITDQLVRYPA